MVQINFTYGLMKKFHEEKYKYLYDKEAFRIFEIRDESEKKFVSNFKIYEFNMDYYMNLWYTKDEEEIEENKLFIMMDLNLDELAQISKKDKVVSKYMEEVKKINEDARFHFMTQEEDQRKMENTMKKREREIGLEDGKTIEKQELAWKFYQNGVDIDILLK